MDNWKGGTKRDSSVGVEWWNKGEENLTICQSLFISKWCYA